MSNTINKVSMGIAGIAVIALILYILGSGLQQAHASAPSGLPAYYATSSAHTIGPTIGLNGSLFGTSTVSALRNCSSRIISTRGESGIMLSFSTVSSTTLSGSVGFYQAASTTVAYDSGIYGCGYWTAYAYGTTTITVAEMQ